VRSLLALALTAGLGAATIACDDTDPQDAGPSPTAGSTSTAAVEPSPAQDVPAGAVVYRQTVGYAETAERRTPVWRLAAWDIDKGREFASFEVGGGGAVPQRASLAGASIAVSYEDRVVLYSLDGRSERELYRPPAGGAIIDAQLSPDGGSVAAIEYARDPCPAPVPPASSRTCGDPRDVTRVFALNAESRAETLSISARDPAFDGLVGAPSNLTWRDDGASFLIWVSVPSERPANIVSARLDGTLAQHPYPVYGIYVSPGGRHAVDDDWEACDLSLATERHAVDLVRLEDGAVLNSVHEPELNIALEEWSPDGDELLVRVAALTPSPQSPGCFVEDAPTARWRVISASGEPPRDVRGAEEARRAWYGERLIEYRCNGEFVAEPFCAANGSSEGTFDVVSQGRVITTGRYQEFEIIGYTK
jgi:hypothetical protein